MLIRGWTTVLIAVRVNLMFLILMKIYIHHPSVRGQALVRRDWLLVFDSECSKTKSERVHQFTLDLNPAFVFKLLMTLLSTGLAEQVFPHLPWRIVCFKCYAEEAAHLPQCSLTLVLKRWVIFFFFSQSICAIISSVLTPWSGWKGRSCTVYSVSVWFQPWWQSQRKYLSKKKSGGGRGLTADSISAPWQSEPSAVCKVFKSKMFSNLVLTFSSMDPTVVGHITTTADDHKVWPPGCHLKSPLAPFNLYFSLVVTLAPGCVLLSLPPCATVQLPDTQ